MQIKPPIWQIVVGISLVLGGFFVFASRAAAATVIHSQNYITTPQTWTKAMSPIVILGSGGIAPGGSVTIEPGVVVKFGVGAQFGTGNGTFTALGTPEEPIIFTALTDDSAGGDTNEDGNATSPAVGYWGRLYLGHDQDQIQFAEFRYGSDCIHTNNAITLSQNQFLSCAHGVNLGPGFSGVVDDNIFDQNVYGIYMLSGSAPTPAGIRNNIVTNSEWAGIYQSGAGFLDISNNEITRNRNGIYIEYGTLSVFSQNNIYQNTDYGFYNHGIFSVDATNNWWGDPSGPFHETQNQNPGGRGDRIAGAPVIFEPWLGQEVKPPSGKNPVIIVPGILGSELLEGNELIWANLTKMLSPSDEFLDILGHNEAGVALNKLTVGDIIRDPLGLFNYSQGLLDSLVSSGYEIDKDLFVFPYDWRKDIDEVSDGLNNFIQSKFDTDQKIDIVAHSMGGLVVKKYLQDFGKAKIDKLIFVGIPHLGAPKAAKVLIFGDQLGIPFLNHAEIKKIARNMPAMNELLPNQDYFINFGGYLRTNSGVLNYEETKTTLSNLGLNQYLLNRAEGFYSSGINNINLSGLKAFNINGCNTGTLSSFRVRNNQDASLLATLPKLVAGDGTVPLHSSDFIDIPEQNEFFVRNIKHNTMMSQQSVRKLITAILTEESYLDSKITQDKSQCKLKGKLLGIFSPVDVKVLDQEGNYAGPDGLESFANDIPGVTYEVFGEEKFVFLPTDEGQVYNVELDATANGSFDLKISEIDGQETSTIYYNEISITDNSVANFVVSQASDNSTIVLDNSTISATVLLNPQQSADETPPTTAASVFEIASLSNWYQNPTSLSLEATDDNSGILKTEYSLNQGLSWQEYSEAVDVLTEGIHEIQFFSTDRAGNREAIKNKVIKIDWTAPEADLAFDPDSKDLQITGFDNLSQVTVDSLVLTDEAGNTTELKLKKRQNKRSAQAELLEMNYNESKVKVEQNQLIYNWSLSRTGELTSLVQLAFFGKDSIFLLYQAPFNHTIIREKKNGKEIKATKPGVVILKIKTDKGKIEYEY